MNNIIDDKATHLGNDKIGICYSGKALKKENLGFRYKLGQEGSESIQEAQSRYMLIILRRKST